MSASLLSSGQAALEAKVKHFLPDVFGSTAALFKRSTPRIQRFVSGFELLSGSSQPVSVS